MPAVGDDEEDEEVGDAQNSAFFTLEMLVSTPRGVTFPITVTFFVSRSMVYEVTPAQLPKFALIFAFSYVNGGKPLLLTCIVAPKKNVASTVAKATE